MSLNRDYFSSKASTYDKEKRRLDNVDNIAKKIIDSVELKPDAHIADIGSGTGLLLERIAPFVSKITAIDRSESMNRELEKKISNIECEVELLSIDIENHNIDIEFDGIISSMTLHHISDIQAIFQKFYSMLKSGGFIALADLDCEDGSFHSIDTGVCHYGFDRDEIRKYAQDAGFIDIRVEDASIIHKPYGEYPIFLLSAKKKKDIFNEK